MQVFDTFKFNAPITYVMTVLHLSATLKNTPSDTNLNTLQAVKDNCNCTELLQEDISNSYRIPISEIERNLS